MDEIKRQEMNFLGISVESTRDAGRYVFTYFAIPASKEEAAVKDILKCLAEGYEVSLQNDLDEGREGYTSFHRSASGLETMHGGHGWSSKWTPIDEADLRAKVFELAPLNRGGDWHQGTLTWHFAGKPFITSSGLIVP